LLIVCENLTDTTTKLTVSEKNVQFMSDSDGSGYGLKAGEILTVKDLLYLTSYQSDTVAILTLAEYISGSEEKFVELMNDKVRSLGLTSTNFSNCTGLHDENNYTTCREMAAIMTHALDNPLCKELLTSFNGYPLVTNMRTEADKCKFYSTWYSGRFTDNPRLETVTVKGGKTGYTDEAGVCLVSYAESRNTGKKYINVIVGKPKGSGLSESKSTEEVKKIYNTYAE
jgi:D-alanyl-D-alanine carboxypeptidase (penicillin-binding protein 5/6)